MIILAIAQKKTKKLFYVFPFSFSLNIHAICVRIELVDITYTDTKDMLSNSIINIISCAISIAISF